MKNRYVVKKVLKTKPSEYAVYDKVGNVRASSTSIYKQDVIDLCDWFNKKDQDKGKLMGIEADLIIIDEAGYDNIE